MATLQPTACCRPQRCLQLPCRAEQAQQKPQPLLASRRSTLAAALLLPAAAAAALVPRAAAAEGIAISPSAGTLDPVPAEATAAFEVASWPRWIDRSFSFSYPQELVEVQDLAYALPPLPRAGVDQVQENPLKAEVRSGDGDQRINVVVRRAGAYKRTLLQVTDIAQLGDAREVAKMLLPPGAVVLTVGTTVIEQPARDTGTVLGVIQRDPVSYYSYEVMFPDKQHAQLTAAAQLGRLYVLAAGVDDSRWQECGTALQEAAASFRLRYKL